MKIWDSVYIYIAWKWTKMREKKPQWRLLTSWSLHCQWLVHSLLRMPHNITIDNPHPTTGKSLYLYLYRDFPANKSFFATKKSFFASCIGTISAVISHHCCIFWQAFGCCALQALVEILIFSIFCAKKQKKMQKVNKFGAKCGNFFCTKTRVKCFGANLKFPFCCKIFHQISFFSSFLHFFHQKILKSRFQPAFGVQSTQELVKNTTPALTISKNLSKW